jgi:hypothetical protein
MSDDPDAPPKPRTLHRALFALGVLGAMVGLCTGVSFIFEAFGKLVGDQMHSQNNLKQISLAVHDYDSALGVLPGPFLDDPNMPEKPSDRLSWRVTILPFLESDPTFNRVNKSEAWNGKNNGPLLDRGWHTYADPRDDDATRTAFRVFHDNGALWDSDPKRRVPFDKIPDGAANTILVVESTVQVPWAQFNEHPYDPAGPLPELGRTGRNSFLACMADGSVRAVKKSVSSNTLRSAITREGGDEVGQDW